MLEAEILAVPLKRWGDLGPERGRACLGPHTGTVAVSDLERPLDCWLPQSLMGQAAPRSPLPRPGPVLRQTERAPQREIEGWR